MPPPQAVLCHLCGGKYFKHSLPIHLKQCEKKWKQVHSRCEHCGSVVANHAWSDHRTHCKPSKQRKSRSKKFTKPIEVPQSVDAQLIPTMANQSKIIECQECEAENAIWKCIQCEQNLCVTCEVELHRKGARAKHQRIPISVSAFKKSNMINNNNDNDNDDGSLEPPTADEIDDPRKPCKFCGRKFNPDRVEKHMRICNVASKKKKKRRVWDGPGKRVEGTVFEEFKYRRAATPPEVLEWKKHGRRWRKERDEFRQILDIGKEIRAEEQKKNDDDNDIPINISAPSHKPTFKPMKLPKLNGASMKVSGPPSSNRSNRSIRSNQCSNSSTSNKMNKNNIRDNKKNIQNDKKNKKSNLIGQKPPIKPKKSSKIDNKSNRSQFGINGTSARGSRRQSKNNSVNNSITNSRINSRSGSKLNSRQTSNNNSRYGSQKGSARSSFSDVKQTNSPPKSRSRIPKPQPKSSNKERNSIRKTSNQSGKQSKSSFSGNKNASISNISKKMNQMTIDNENKSPNTLDQRQPITSAQSQSQPIKKSVENHLPRGQELGANTTNVFKTKPKNMNDYRERERIRREQARGKNGKKGMTISSSIENKRDTRKPAKQLPRGPGGKKMPRVEIQKQLNFAERANNDVNIKKINKPKDTKDLSNQRAAYFESMMKQQD